jgi:hypothetical protein
MPEAADPFEPLSHEELNEIRMRIIEGEEIPEDEFTMALQSLCANRKNDVIKSKHAPPRAARRKPRVNVDLDGFLNEPKPPV